jgi:hypothetical protein
MRRLRSEVETMTKDAATRTIDAAEARERAKAIRALTKWLPHRIAQLALARQSVDVMADTDAGAIERVLADWNKRAHDDAKAEKAAKAS